MTPQPPRNRAERRQYERAVKRLQRHPERLPQLPHPILPPLSKPPDLAISGGESSGEDDETSDEVAERMIQIMQEDVPPADRRSRGRPKGSQNRVSAVTKANQKLAKMRKTLTGYHAGVGAAVYMANHYDGEVIIKQAENCADGLLAIGKEFPKAMEILEILCFEMWWMPAAVAYGTMSVAIMANHQVLPRQIAELVRQPLPPEPEHEAERHAQEQETSLHGPWETASQPSAAPDVAPSTETMEPLHTALGSVPDEGLPHGAEIMIREASRRTGRPYEELRQEVLVQIEQERLRQNGNIVRPATLGQPIAKE